MKSTISYAIMAGIATSLLFTSCTKDKDAEAVSGNYSSGESTQNAATDQPLSYTTTSDRIDAIVKDLSLSSYSLSFSKTYPEAGITRTAYGADNYLAFADPQNLISPDPIRLKYKRIPIWRRPNIIWPTCPDMIIDISRLRQVRELLVKADYYQYSSLKEIGLVSGGGFLANEKFTGQFRTMKLDKIDELTRDLNHERFLMLNDPRSLGTGATRSFYGFADLNSIVFKPYRKNLRDLLKPTLKGCFDPLVLSVIQKRLQSLDPVYYKSLSVTPIPETKSIAVLSMY